MSKFGLILKFIERNRLHGLEVLAPLFASEQQRDEASPVAPGPAAPAREWVAGESPYLRDPDPYHGETWCIPGEP